MGPPPPWRSRRNSGARWSSPGDPAEAGSGHAGRVGGRVLSAGVHGPEVNLDFDEGARAWLAAVLADRRLAAQQRAVALALATDAAGGFCLITQARLGELAGMTARSAAKQVGILAALGYVAGDKLVHPVTARRLSTQYELLVPRGPSRARTRPSLR